MTANPTAGPGQAPAFLTAAACRDWLAAAPLTDAPQMVALFLRELKLQNHAQFPVIERLDILELLRRPVYEAQEAFGKKFAGKLQPLAAPEQAAFDACCTLWHTLATGYMRCAEACFANDAQMRAKAGLVLQRALATLVAGQIESHRANRSPSAEHWRVLHQLYAAAEQLGAAAQEVNDPSHHGKAPCSAQSAYTEAMLLGVANLHEHSQRQIAWAARWARRWAPKVRVLAAPPAELTTQAIPLCVDVGGEGPAAYRPFAGPGARWLDTAELRHSLKKRLAMLAQGEDPAKLNLGDDCTQPACEQLLTLLYQRWCKGAAVRGYERRAASGPCRFVAGVEGIHYYVAGRRPFKEIAPKDLSTLRREQEEIATFGRVATHRDDNFSEQKGYAVEEWQTLENWHLVNTSAAGMRILRPLAQGGARLGLRQLVAVGSGDSEWTLGCVRWTLVGDAFEIGLLLYPGLPRAIALRGAGLAAAKEAFRPGFLLPTAPAIKQEASAVIPAGVFKAGRLIDVFDGKPGRLRLTRLLDRGADFERVAYEPA